MKQPYSETMSIMEHSPHGVLMRTFGIGAPPAGGPQDLARLSAWVDAAPVQPGQTWVVVHNRKQYKTTRNAGDVYNKIVYRAP